MIRPETEADRAAIDAVNVAAFGGRIEADLVKRLRADGDLVLSLVAEGNGRVVGHVAFSRLIVRDAAEEREAVSLAPLAVIPAFQRRGIGSALVAAGHAALREGGESLSIVLGEPTYYGRFGYSHARAAGFDSVYQGSDAFMALAFADAPFAGAVTFATAFAEL